jgi:hypothetical protein
VEGVCEHDDEPSVSIKCWELLEQLSDRRLLKKGLSSMELVGKNIINIKVKLSL